MPTYPLIFDPSGKNFEKFNVPTGKRVYLVRAEQAEDGTATIQDLLTLENYKLPEGVTICETNIKPDQEVALVFISRTNPAILLVNAEVISPRKDITPCKK